MKLPQFFALIVAFFVLISNSSLLFGAQGEFKSAYHESGVSAYDWWDQDFDLVEAPDNESQVPAEAERVIFIQDLVGVCADVKMPDSAIKAFLKTSQEQSKYKISDVKISAGIFEQLFEKFAADILHFCKKNKKKKSVQAIVEGLKKMLTHQAGVVSLLIDAGIEIGVAYGSEQTPPFVDAARRGFFLVVPILLKKNQLSILAGDGSGNTAHDYVAPFLEMRALRSIKAHVTTMLRCGEFDDVLRKVIEQLQKQRKLLKENLIFLNYYQYVTRDFLKKENIDQDYFPFFCLEPYNGINKFLGEQLGDEAGRNS